MDNRYSTEWSNEFYKLNEIGREKIESSDIFKDKKDAMYQVLDKIIKKYEENKTAYFASKKCLEDYSEALEYLDSLFSDLNSGIEKLLSISENNYKKLKVVLAASKNNCETSKNLLLNSKSSKDTTYH